MRTDFAMLEVFDIQSTSDQQDHILYPPIAAAAPIQLLPEQAANWAYPQAWMEDEELAFTMVTGLAGRLYLSGFLDRLDDRQLALVQDATALFRDLRAGIGRAVPRWPAGLPQWYGDTVALRLEAPGQDLLYVWHRGEVGAEIRVDLGGGIGAADLREVYPRTLAGWQVHDEGSGVVVLRPGVAGPSARIYCIRSNRSV